jgi:hypothetical protein
MIDTGRDGDFRVGSRCGEVSNEVEEMSSSRRSASLLPSPTRVFGDRANSRDSREQ